MVTKAQAIEAQEFHCGPCIVYVGPRGGRTLRQEVWRRNGKTKVWKTRPEDFKVPVKHGLYKYGYIDNGNASTCHTAADCVPQEVKRGAS